MSNLVSHRKNINYLAVLIYSVSTEYLKVLCGVSNFFRESRKHHKTYYSVLWKTDSFF